MAKHTMDSVAKKLSKDITEKYDEKLKAQIGLQNICVLGNHRKHKAHMRKIAKTLSDLDYPATLVKYVKTTHLPDFEKESKILEKVEVLLLIDHKKGGVVSESSYLMNNKHLLQKAILLVPDTLSDDDFFSTEKHYVYYPNKIRYSEEKLVELGIKAAIQTSHCIALNIINCDVCQPKELKKERGKVYK